MINNKINIKENKRTIVAVAITFVVVFGMKVCLGSFAKEQTPFNPSVSTISTNVVAQVQPYAEETIYVEDNTLYEGDTVITVQGTEGIREEMLEITSDGTQVTVVKVLETNIIKEAVASEIHIGTKERPDYILPVENYKFTYGVGYREDGFHKGLDLICEEYSVVSATASGTVKHSGWMDGYGYCVFIEHENGIESRYAHMNETLVTVGEEVKQGQQIGWSGCTGDSECAHVHMEMLENGSVIDPVERGYLNP